MVIWWNDKTKLGRYLWWSLKSKIHFFIKGKLLVDIKNGFNCILKTKEETENLSIKIINFEKKIIDL